MQVPLYTRSEAGRRLSQSEIRKGIAWLCSVILGVTYSDSTLPRGMPKLHYY